MQKQRFPRRYGWNECDLLKLLLGAHGAVGTLANQYRLRSNCGCITRHDLCIFSDSSSEGEFEEDSFAHTTTYNLPSGRGRLSVRI